jgi:hypothetical protein
MMYVLLDYLEIRIRLIRKKDVVFIYVNLFMFVTYTTLIKWNKKYFSNLFMLSSIVYLFLSIKFHKIFQEIGMWWWIHEEIKI